MSASKERKTIVEILQRVSVELASSAVMIDDLHRIVEDIGMQRFHANDACVRSAQSIDIVHQRISGLAHFVSELAELMPQHWSVESHAAAKKVRLAHLAARLSHNDEAADRLLEHSVGEMELF